MSFKLIKSCYLKASMRRPISDQQQLPKPYLTPFSHKTSVMDDDRETTSRQHIVPQMPYNIAVSRQKLNTAPFNNTIANTIQFHFPNWSKTSGAVGWKHKQSRSCNFLMTPQISDRILTDSCKFPTYSVEFKILTLPPNGAFSPKVNILWSTIFHQENFFNKFLTGQH